MKRKILVLVLVAFVTGGAFAQGEFSIGGGFIFDGARVSYRDRWLNHHASSFGFGGFVFLGAAFAELSIAFTGGFYEESFRREYRFGYFRDSNFSSSFFAMGLSLLGKFPFALGSGSLTVFPLLGIGANLMLSSGTQSGMVLLEAMAGHI